MCGGVGDAKINISLAIEIKCCLFQIQAGDFIGCMMNGGDVLALETSATDRVEYHAAPGAAVDTSLVVPGAATYTPAAVRHMLRAHAIQPAVLKYRKIYKYAVFFDSCILFSNFI